MKIYIGRDVYDVDLTGVTDKQALVWDAASGKLKPSNNVPNASTVGGYLPATAGANAHVVLTDGSGGIAIGSAQLSANQLSANSFLLGDGRSIVTAGTWATRTGSFQSIPNATLTVVGFNSQIGPANGGGIDWDGGTAFYCRQTGWHLAYGSFEMNNVSGRVRSWVQISGGRYLGQSSTYVGSANLGGVGICFPVYMNANEYVQFIVFQESGGARDLRYSDNATNYHLCLGGLLRL